MLCRAYKIYIISYKILCKFYMCKYITRTRIQSKAAVNPSQETIFEVCIVNCCDSPNGIRNLNSRMQFIPHIFYCIFSIFPVSR